MLAATNFRTVFGCALMYAVRAMMPLLIAVTPQSAYQKMRAFW